MKNITTIKKTALASKTAFASKVAFATILLGFLFVGWGGASLQAQERKTGWFVGISPYAMDLNLKKTTRQTTEVSVTVGAIIYDATVPNFASDDTHTIRFGGSAIDNLAVANAAREDAIHLCREGTVPVITTGDVNSIGQTFPVDTIVLDSYDETTSLTDDLSQLLTNTPATTIGTNSEADQAEAAPWCKAFFEADLSTSTSDEESSKTQSLQGTGIEFGYDFEKYSLSFNQLQWSGGDDKLQAQMLLFRYFLPYSLSVGGGFASAKLDTEFGSDSGTAPVFHFGYDYPITKNFQISLSYTWLGVNLAVQDTQSVTPPSPSTQKRAVIGMVRRGGQPDNNYSAAKGTASGMSYDTRIVVTATIPTEATVQETTTIQSTEIKNLSTIKIGFRYSF